MKVKIKRIDYKNPTKTGGLLPLPLLDNLDDITDINEISQIYMGEDMSLKEASALSELFPESKLKASNVHGLYHVVVGFKTFWSTGEVCNKDVEPRIKAVAKLKEMAADNDS